MSSYTNQCGLTKEKENEIELRLGQTDIELTPKSLNIQENNSKSMNQERDTREKTSENIEIDSEMEGICKDSLRNKEHKISCSTLNFHLLNIQGLTQPKVIEIEGELKSNDIYCLTETQMKRKQVKTSDSTRELHKMRSLTDKKGGGL